MLPTMAASYFEQPVGDDGDDGGGGVKLREPGIRKPSSWQIGRAHV